MRQLRKTPTSSNTISENAGIQNISKSTRCRILRPLPAMWNRKFDLHWRIFIKKTIWHGPKNIWNWIFKKCYSPMNAVHHRCTWRMEQDMGHRRSYSSSSSSPSTGRQWRNVRAGIIRDELVGPFHVPDGVKLTAVAYIDFLKQNVYTWFEKKPLSFRKNIVFLHDNAKSHSAKLTAYFLATVGFKCEKLMTWPASSPI